MGKLDNFKNKIYFTIRFEFAFQIDQFIDKIEIQKDERKEYALKIELRRQTV